MKSLTLVPIKIKEANEFVSNFHRHNKPVQGCKFCIGASSVQGLTGVAIVGRQKEPVVFFIQLVGEHGKQWVVLG